MIYITLDGYFSAGDIKFPNRVVVLLLGIILPQKEKYRIGSFIA
jgi:hypothetical protein